MQERSYLFVPGDRPERFDKALASGAHAAPLDDAAQLETDVRRSRRFGFGAKLCIHTRQMAGAHTGFAPTAAEVAWAQRVVEALAAGPLGAITVDGKMVDKPIALLAQAILAEAA